MLMAFEAAELPIIGFNMVTYHKQNHHSDVEVGGLLKRTLVVPYKKGCFYSIKTGDPKKLQTVPLLLWSSRLVSLHNGHRNAVRSVVELTLVRAATSSNGALLTPSCFSER